MGEESLESLLKEYCPPLDPPLVLSLSSDFELSHLQQLDALRSQLDAFRSHAIEEQATSFDPSGTGGLVPISCQNPATESSPASETASKSYDVTTCSTALSDMVLENRNSEDHDVETPWPFLDQSGKERRLQSIFPAIDSIAITSTLRETNGDENRSVEILLNYTVMLEHDPESTLGTPILQRGVDGFAENDLSRRRRKGKKRIGFDTPVSATSSATASDVEDEFPRPHNVWQSGSKPPSSQPPTSKIIPQYLPLDLTSDPEPTRQASPTSRITVEHGQIKAKALASREAGQSAFSQASVANRRGRSDHHMFAAAAYYAEEGRKHLQHSKAMNSVAADALVSQQSRPNVTDLHGVDVLNATRIAVARTSAWWESLGDSKFLPGGGSRSTDAFRIVTGVGHHSENGRSKLTPAVYKALEKDGWKVNIVPGEITVTGRGRR